jgi:hypothetical protein
MLYRTRPVEPHACDGIGTAATRCFLGKHRHHPNPLTSSLPAGPSLWRVQELVSPYASHCLRHFSSPGLTRTCSSPLYKPFNMFNAPECLGSTGRGPRHACRGSHGSTGRHARSNRDWRHIAVAGTKGGAQCPAVRGVPALELSRMTSEILCFAIALCECALWKLLHNLAMKLASQN